MKNERKEAKDLITLAEPILYPYLRGEGWTQSFFATLVESARQMSPTQAKRAALGLCLKENFHFSTADHFAQACRQLAILRKYYEKDFLEAIGERFTH